MSQTASYLTPTRMARMRARLAKVRGKRSQHAFARDLGIYPQMVQRYEKHRPPSADFLAIVAVREGISIDWLLLGKGKRRVEEPAAEERAKS